MAPKAVAKSDKRKSTTKGTGTRGKKAGKSVTGQTKAGIIFAPSRVARLLRGGRFSDRFSSSAGVYLAGVLQYLASEILEIAGEIAIEHKKQRVLPKHIQMAIANDDELLKMFANI